MKMLLKLGLILGTMLLVLTGCRSGVVHNVVNAPIEVNTKTSEADVFKAIKIAGTGLGWVISKKAPGEAKGVLNLRKHQAVVKITYNKKDYSINYDSSIALNYNAEKNTIHSNYNGWVQNLKKAIDIQLTMYE